jgi:predicted urease superfamily metal-dependent hydrolase
MGLKPEDQKRIMEILDKKTRQILTTMAKGLEAVKKYVKEEKSK